MIRPSELAFDIDGVIADTMSLLIDIAREDFGINGLRLEDIRDYSLRGLAGIGEEVLVAIIDRILTGNHSGGLAPLEDAPSVLRRLNRVHAPTLFVTARPNGDQAGRWIADTLDIAPDGFEIVATGSFEDKREVLISRNIKYFVEDRLETCFILSEAGIRPIVFKQPWNRRPHPFREVENWRQLEAMIAFE